jgi:hypothetical protein
MDRLNQLFSKSDTKQTKRVSRGVTGLLSWTTKARLLTLEIDIVDVEDMVIITHYLKKIKI